MILSPFVPPLFPTISRIMDGHGEVVGMGIDMPILLPYISTSIVLLQFKFDNDKKHIMRKIIVVYGTRGRGIAPMSTKCHVCDMHL